MNLEKLNKQFENKSLQDVLTFVFTFLISYLLASDEVFDGYKQFGVTPSNSKIVGSGLIFFYILSLLAVLLVVYSEIVKLFK